MIKPTKPLILILWLFLIMLGANFAFANNNTAEPSLKGTADILVLLAQMASWIRIPIANLAGKLMTNSFVNGEVFHLSSFLFKCRSILRVFCNFIFVAVVLKIVFDVAMSKSETLTGLGSKIGKLLISALFVNLSRFLMWAMVDLSNLAVFWVSNIGYSLINSSPFIKKQITSQMVCIPKVIKYDHKVVQKFYENGSTWWVDIPTINCWTENSPDKSVNRIKPSYDDLSGPFMYFGYGVFRFFEYLDVSTISNWVWFSSSLSSLTIAFFVKLFLMAMFLTPLIALLVVNAARIFYIRIRFICSPIIALKRGLQDLKIEFLDGIFGFGKSEPLWWWRNQDFFDISNIIWALFTPATVTATLFMSIMIISSMFWSLVWSNSTWFNTPNTWNNTQIQNDLNNFKNKVTGTQNEIINGRLEIEWTRIKFWNTDSVELNGNIVSDATNRVMGSFGYMIICVMTVGLLRAVFRVGLSTSSLLSKLGNNIMDIGKRTIMQWLRLPIGREWKMVSFDQIDKKILNMDKRYDSNRKSWILADNYIKPEQARQNRKAEEAKANILKNLWIWYDIKYTWRWVTFKGKANEVWNERLPFETNTKAFLTDLMNDVSFNQSVKWTIDGGNSWFKSSIKTWLQNGWDKFLEISNKKDYLWEDNKTDYEMMYLNDRRLWWFISNVFTKNIYKMNANDLKNNIKDGKPLSSFKFDPSKVYSNDEIANGKPAW